MKTKLNLIQICLMGAVLFALPAVVQAQLTWITNADNTLTITGYTGPPWAVTIPSNINSLTVTIIGDQAFAGSEVTSVTIPDSITTIETNAFEETSLTSITIPGSVTNIQDGAFDDSVMLTAINVNAGNRAYTSVNGILFNTNQTTLLEYPASKNGASYFSYTVPNSVTRIGDGAFDGCGFLNSITLGTNIANIGEAAFSLTSLSTITIPAGVTNIGQYAFEDCALLTSIYFKGNSPSYGVYSFETHADTTVYYYAGTSGWGSDVEGVGYSFPTVMLNAPNPAGSLQVTITPEGAITSGAQWQVDGGVPQPGGATVLGLAVGNHTVSFTTVNGWATPSNQIVSVSANSTASATGTYVLQAPPPFTWTTNNGTITITGYQGEFPGGLLTIPSEIEGLPVTSIGDDAFYGFEDITSVTIPNSITSIGDDAFWECYELTSVTIPPSVTSIGDYAFGACGLTSFTIGTNFTSFGDGVFAQCFSLTSVTIPDGATSIGVEEFSGCYNLTSITIPNSVASIGEGAFNYCQALTTVTIPNSVTNIGANAFADCNLTSVTIPDSVSDIGTNAFYQCDSLTDVTISSSGTSIGNGAFSYCDSLTNVTVSGSGTRIGNGAFLYCEHLTTVTMTDSVTSIGAEAFADSGLTNVTIPNSVISIGTGAFSGTSLTKVTIGTNVTSIGAFAFAYNSGLTNVTIPNSVTNVGEGVFNNCARLAAITVNAGNLTYTNVNGVLFNKTRTALIEYPAGAAGSTYTIPNGVTSIGGYAFYSCALTSVTIPNSVTSIGEYAFYDCYSLASLTIPNSVTSIGGYAFWECGSLTSVAIPNGVTNIGDYAFYNCARLAGVTIGTNVTDIGQEAFYNTSLTSATIPASVTNIGDQAFALCPFLTAITVDSGNPAYVSVDGVLFNKSETTLIQYPIGNLGTSYTISNSVTTIGDSAFYFCDYLTSVTIPNSVTNIGEGAFSECFSMKTITVEAGNPDYSSMNGVLFDKSQSSLIQYPCGLTGGYTIPNSVTNIEDEAFGDSGLTSITIDNGVTSIGAETFIECYGLTSVTIGNDVTNIGELAFYYCYSITNVCFEGNAPVVDNSAFLDDTALSVIYYVNGTTGWGTTFDDIPTSSCEECAGNVVVAPPNISLSAPQITSGKTNFTFLLSGPAGSNYVLQASTNLANWSPVSTSTIPVGGSINLSNPATGFNHRFYRAYLQ